MYTGSCYFNLIETWVYLRSKRESLWKVTLHESCYICFKCVCFLEACMVFLPLKVLMCPSFMPSSSCSCRGGGNSLRDWLLESRYGTMRSNNRRSRILPFLCKVKAHHPIWFHLSHHWHPRSSGPGGMRQAQDSLNTELIRTMQNVPNFPKFHSKQGEGTSKQSPVNPCEGAWRTVISSLIQRETIFYNFLVCGGWMRVDRNDPRSQDISEGGKQTHSLWRHPTWNLGWDLMKLQLLFKPRRNIHLKVTQHRFQTTEIWYVLLFTLLYLYMLPRECHCFVLLWFGFSVNAFLV